MGRLSTALNLPKQIFLKDWGATEFSTDPNILLSFTFILEPTPLHGSIITYSSVFSSIYPAPQKIYFWGSFWQLRDVNDNSTQWFNDSSSPILPLTGWERDNAQGPAGTITPILTNTKNISIKKQNLGSGKILVRKAPSGIPVASTSSINITHGNIFSYPDQNPYRAYQKTFENSPTLIADATGTTALTQYQQVNVYQYPYVLIFNTGSNRWEIGRIDYNSENDETFFTPQASNPSTNPNFIPTTGWTPNITITAA